MKTTEPKKMKANPAANGSTFSSMHDGEHDERFSCKDTGCLPVDPAPVTEPRQPSDFTNGSRWVGLDEVTITVTHFDDRFGGHLSYDTDTGAGGHMGRNLWELLMPAPTPPPAPVPAIDEPIPTPEQVKRMDRLVMGDEAKSEGTPVKRHLTASERRGLSVHEACIHIIERLCAELDSKDGEIQLFSGATEEQRRRADTLERLREYWIASNEASRERLRMAVIEGRRLSEVLDERDQLKRDLAAAHKLIQSSSKPCGWPNCEPAKQALADLAAAQLRENGLWEVFLPCIQDYLLKGGHFNPECMEHEKVRELLKDIRAALTKEDK